MWLSRCEWWRLGSLCGTRKNVARLKDGVLSHLRKTGKGPPRLQNGTSWFYFATDQWKYEESNVDRLKSPLAKTEELKHQHPADYNVLAARLGWLPSYPQFNKNSLLFAEEAKDEGIDSNEAILQRAIDEVKSKQHNLQLKILT